MKIRFNRAIRIILIIQCTSSSFLVFSQTDYEFWFVAPAIASDFIPPSPIILHNLNQPISITLTAYDSAAIVTISEPVNPIFVPIITTVPPFSNVEVDLTPYLDQIENKPADTINPYGIKVSSSRHITAYYSIASPYNSEMFSLKGRNALGNEFIIPAQSQWPNYPYCNPPARNVFDIVATEDSTNVQITPSSDIIGHSAGIQFSVLLNRGQTWSGRAVSGDSSAHLGGTFVLSDKPIAVTVSDDEINAPPVNPYSEDLAGDQLIPKGVCGTEYIDAAIGGGYPPWLNRTYIYAFEDSTRVYRAGVQIALLNRGESCQIIVQTTYAFFYLTSTKKIMLYQFGGVRFTNSQPAAFIEPTLNCTGSREVVMTRPTWTAIGGGFDFHLVTKNGAQGSFTISGAPTLIINKADFDTVQGTNGTWVHGYFMFPSWNASQRLCENQYLF